MDGKGWCWTCCPSDIQIEKNACSHIDDLGVRCTTKKKIDGLCLKHCPNDNPAKVKLQEKNAECMAKSRKKQG
jgi:hypothetical protein